MPIYFKYIFHTLIWKKTAIICRKKFTSWSISKTNIHCTWARQTTCIHFLKIVFPLDYPRHVGWRDRNQQDATNLMFIIKLLSQHVSGNIIPTIRRLCRTVTFTVHTARVPAPQNHSHHNQCRTPHAAAHTLVLLMMGIMMPETCRDKSLIINIRLVASFWFLSLHPTFMMHDHTSLKYPGHVSNK